MSISLFFQEEIRVTFYYKIQINHYKQLLVLFVCVGMKEVVQKIEVFLFVSHVLARSRHVERCCRLIDTGLLFCFTVILVSRSIGIVSTGRLPPFYRRRIRSIQVIDQMSYVAFEYWKDRNKCCELNCKRPILVGSGSC